MSLGLFVSAFARTEFQAVQFMPAIVLPQFLLCGLLLPRDLLPPALELLSDVLPLSYAVDATKEIAAGATSLADIGTEVAVVVGFIVVAIGLGALTLRRKTA
jgi:ABC-2 type transport system permease protein